MKRYQDPVVWMTTLAMGACGLTIFIVLKLASAGKADREACSKQCAPYQARILDSRCHCLSSDGAWEPANESKDD